METFYMIFLAFCFAAACWDFLFFKVPNAIIAFLIALFILKILVIQAPSAFYYPLFIFSLFLVVGFGLFVLKIIGAGDAKFLAVGAMWASELSIPSYLFITSIAGGILGLIYLKTEPAIFQVRKSLVATLESHAQPLMNFLKPGTGTLSIPKSAQGRTVIPYGVAIFVGCAGFTLFGLTR